MVLIISIILIFVVFVASLSHKLNVPLIIIALATGLIFGSDVTGLIYFDDASFGKNLANILLVFILFAGGFGTSAKTFRSVVVPTSLLATVGILVTAGATGILFSLLSGWPLPKAILVAVIISSTDAAAVFSILRTRSIRAKVSSISEIESAANDPMAIISTGFVINLVMGEKTSTLTSILHLVWQLGAGVGFGLLIGFAAVFLFRKVRNIDNSYYYILLIGFMFLSFGLADLCKASGMLSVFFTGLVMGNNKLPFRNGLSTFVGTLSFIANLGLFVFLGLLAFPRQFASIWLPGVIIFGVMTFVGRPLAVLLCTPGSGLSLKEKLFLSWSGLRGAVPIVLATYPAAAGLDGDHAIFNVVFFAVALSMVVQGTTIGKLVDLFKLGSRIKPKPEQTMELVTISNTSYELVEIRLDEDQFEGSCAISKMGLPADTTITMVSRDKQVIPPSGSTIVLPGDSLFVLLSEERLGEIRSVIEGCYKRKPGTIEENA